MTASTRFSGNTVIVTGSSGGIGEGIARRFAEEGANVVINSRSREDCEKVAKTLDTDRTLVVSGDVSKPDFATEIIDKTVDRFGALDVLVNNAGVGTFGMLTDATDEDIDRVLGINVKGVLYLCRAAIPHLAKSSADGGGAIINVSSLSGVGGDWILPVYNASKGAVSNLTRSLALQLGHKNIRVNAVLPTITRSEMSAGMMDNDDMMKAFMNRIPLGRIGEPEDIAGPVAFLASKDAQFVTGVNLAVDGGTNASNGQPNMMART